MHAGRPFHAQDFVRGAPRVAIISYAFWRDQLGAVTDLATLRLASGLTIIGVTAEPVRFPDVSTPDVFVPLILPPGNVAVALRAIARLRPGTPTEEAEAELARITQTAEPMLPIAVAVRLQHGDTPIVQPLQRYLAGDFVPVLLVAFGVAGAILLIACANVAGMLLARLTSRHRELAIRVAIGATALRLTQLLLTESLLLAIAGGGAAWLALTWSLAALKQALIGIAPHTDAIALDTRVASFVIGAVVLSGCLCAAIPIARVLMRGRREAWRVREASAEVSGTNHVVGRVLVACQVGSAVVLLIGALLLLGTLSRLTNADMGFIPQNLSTLKISPNPGSWPRPHEDALEQITSRIGLLPDVVSAAVTTAFPLEGHAFGFDVFLDTESSQVTQGTAAGVHAVSRGYFRTMGIRVLSGRGFDDRDTSSAPRVAIVNEAFVRAKNLTNATVLERRLSLGGGPQYAKKESAWSIPIVGVVADVKDSTPGGGSRPTVYQAVEQPSPNFSIGGAKVVVRTMVDPNAASEPIRQTIRAVVPGAAVFDVQPMEWRITKLLAPQRQRAFVFGLFAVTAVMLAAIGLYGLVVRMVSQEMRDFGIRLALGASHLHIAGLVVRRGLGSAGVGITVGLGVAALLTRAIDGVLYGVVSTDAETFAGAAVIMLIVAAFASYIPARRALRADPLSMLRLH